MMDGDLTLEEAGGLMQELPLLPEREAFKLGRLLGEWQRFRIENAALRARVAELEERLRRADREWLATIPCCWREGCDKPSVSLWGDAPFCEEHDRVMGEDLRQWAEAHKDEEADLVVRDAPAPTWGPWERENEAPTG